MRKFLKEERFGITLVISYYLISVGILMVYNFC